MSDRRYFAEPDRRYENKNDRSYRYEDEEGERRNRGGLSPKEERYPTSRRTPTSPTSYRSTGRNPESYSDRRDSKHRNYDGGETGSNLQYYNNDTYYPDGYDSRRINSPNSNQHEYDKGNTLDQYAGKPSPGTYRKDDENREKTGYSYDSTGRPGRSNTNEITGRSGQSGALENAGKSDMYGTYDGASSLRDSDYNKHKSNDHVRDSSYKTDNNKSGYTGKTDNNRSGYTGKTDNNRSGYNGKTDNNRLGYTGKSDKTRLTKSPNKEMNLSFDRRLSNSISQPDAHERYKIRSDYSNDSIEHDGDELFNRKLSNSIALPGVHEPTKRSKIPTTPKKTKTPTNTPNKTLKSPTTKKISPKRITDEPASNLDVTGEKARLLSVRRLDTPEPRGKLSDSNESDSSSTISDTSDTPDVFLPKRYILAIMMFLGFVNMYAIRVNLNVAIGAMVKNHTLIKGGVASVVPPEFDWSSRLQGVVLGSFYYGYMLLQIPGGYFAMRFGGTKIFGVAIFLASILTLLTPFATRFSVWALVTLRVCEGVVLGVMLPCNHQIWSSWAPLQERTTLVTIAIAGMNVGTVVTMPLTGLLTKYGFDGGWASVFYCFGAFGILWFMLWVCVVHSTPASHPTISKKERKYIEKNVTTRKSMNIPWKAIFTSRAVWAVIIGNVANDWGLYTILICLPLFLMDIMKFNVQTMGFIASLPFLLKAIVGPVGGVLADVLRYKYTTTANVRRIFYAVGAMSAAVMIVIAGYSHTPTLAVLSMCVGVALSGLLHSGYEVNVLDIAPCLSGIVMGISNTAGTTTGFLSPLLVGYMTENKLRSEWITVFWITFVIYLVGTILFGLLLSGEAQHWGLDDDDDEENDIHRRP